MSYSGKLTVLICFLLLICPALGQNSGADVVSQKSGNTGQTVQSCTELPSLFARSLLLAEKPGGLIVTNAHCSIPLLPDDHEQQPLNVRLDALTESIPSLVWTDNAGVINLVPRDEKHVIKTSPFLCDRQGSYKHTGRDREQTRYRVCRNGQVRSE